MHRNYIEAYLNVNQQPIVDIDFSANPIIVYTEDDEEIEVSLDDVVIVKVFERLEMDTLKDFIKAAHDESVYIALDADYESQFQKFSDSNLKEMIDEQEFEFAQVEALVEMPIARLKFEERSMTIEDLKDYINEA